VQTNLLGSAPDQWLTALRELGVATIETVTINASDVELPPLPDYDGPTVFYGSSRLKVLAAQSAFVPGVWFDAEQFHARSVARHWGDWLLNYPGWIGPLAECPVPAADQASDAGETSEAGESDSVFIGPAESLKIFKGAVLSLSALRALVASTPEVSSARFQLTRATEVLIAPVQRPLAEWRCFVADGRIVATTQYLLGGVVTITGPGVAGPDFNTEFEAALRHWCPAPIFALDVAKLVDGSYRIVEANCFNSSGQYGADLRVVFAAASHRAMQDWRARR
jgi:ATP-grasp domain, R2K clade family 3